MVCCGGAVSTNHLAYTYFGLIELWVLVDVAVIMMWHLQQCFAEFFISNVQYICFMCIFANCKFQVAQKHCTLVFYICCRTLPLLKAY